MIATAGGRLRQRWVPGLWFDHAEVFHHLELAAGIGTAQQGPFMEMLVRCDFEGPLGSVKCCADEGTSHFAGICAAATFDGFGPEMHKAVSRFSWIIHYSVVTKTFAESFGK